MKGAAGLLAVLGAAILCALPAEARAEDAAKAAVLAEAAAARSKQGERRAAIDLYDDAYAAAPRREYLREIAALYDSLALGGDPRDLRLAISYYERYLVGEPETPERTAMEARIAALRAWKAKIRSEPPVPVAPAAQAAPANPKTVPLAILAYKPDFKYEVTLAGRTCETPCSVTVPPGPLSLKATGTGEISVDFVMPPRPGQMRLHHTDSSNFTAGAILLPTGIVTGASLWALIFACPSESSGCQLANVTIWPILGGSAMIAGIVLLAQGRVIPPPDSNRVDLVGRRSTPLRFASFGLGPVPGGGGTAGARFEF
jgi:hypothetical protein